MSKGCFQVTAFLFKNYTNFASGRIKAQVETAVSCLNVYIPTKDILQVKLYKTCHEYCSAYALCMRPCCSRIKMVEELCLFENQPRCSCGVLAKFDQIEDAIDYDVTERKIVDREISKADACATDCVCNFKIFPLYEIVVGNEIEEMTKGQERAVSVPKQITYIVHSSEREHMERYLAGTDDPLYDYVHHLKYNPANGSEALAAQENFEMRQKAGKRQKLENSQI